MPLVVTRTPVVHRISRAHVLAQRCPNSPELSKREEATESVPRRIV
jgi:hypothetical protein